MILKKVYHLVALIVSAKYRYRFGLSVVSLFSASAHSTFHQILILRGHVKGSLNIMMSASIISEFTTKSTW